MDEKKKAKMLNLLGKHRSKYLAAIFREIAKVSPRYQHVLWHHFLRLNAMHPREVPSYLIRSYVKYQDDKEKMQPLYPTKLSAEHKTELEQKATKLESESDSKTVENES